MNIMVMSSFRFCMGTILVLIVTIFIYLLVALLLSIIPVNNQFIQPETGIEIYIKSNGVHTDLVLPVTNPYYNWNERLKEEDFQHSQAQFIAFGWGDKGFYLDTPTWADLKFSTAFKAAFWLGTSAMHVTKYENEPQIGKYVRKITISPDNYNALVQYIDNSFDKDSLGHYIHIKGHHYSGVDDNFYEAIGTYNLFKTCNVWTNTGLKKAGIKTAVWGPFDWSILYHFKQ